MHFQQSMFAFLYGSYFQDVCIIAQRMPDDIDLSHLPMFGYLQFPSTHHVQEHLYFVSTSKYEHLMHMSRCTVVIAAGAGLSNSRD